MFNDVSSGLELRQDDAVARALMAEECLQAGLVLQRLCLACGYPIDAGRLTRLPRATRCSLCVDYITLARRR
ncbi:hypothetical protein LOY64_30165 (plasmid) [Pseudomonas corrugata]|uniref:hypothetical protein n=1 Tax=Pseudomonas corrugata TaxID=47879 RepID=UPI002230E6B9|nr:hypothetical protein [Pseudomonas corrugata]UZD98460.1 hypothetical protein LOY64_30230 [Pseudomonas corrugata]UZD98535.1 hypothetical protein LOY64_30165 [Pseudomonas corrugata]